MKKFLIFLDAIGIVISICMLFIYRDTELFEIPALFLMSMAYTIWQDKILRFVISLNCEYPYDIEPSKFAYTTAKVVTVILTAGGYICCATYFLALSS